ncbi:Rnf electron transport complex subunit RnfB [Solilutibacter silvestris]|uniref:Rnf electron transport complex subunit RnfB n=1 Tax=Solilutibacter silvestris TaxID=1645665 RepID=UPI000CA00898|nr:Rnf electron transport complex subunit RnfB [Lysobacter silvestris]
MPPARSDSALVERLDRLLPQTQCGQCGYDGCRPYAEAIARGEAGIDHCPPGGDEGAIALAAVLGVPALPYDRTRGECKPAIVAEIIEDECIGCTKCIAACPVDAIIGGSKLMHVVIDDLCTGCELCIPPCPVDCIVMVSAPQTD